MCRIPGIRIPDLRNKMLYAPLSRRNHPTPTPTDVIEYDIVHKRMDGRDASFVHVHKLLSNIFFETNQYIYLMPLYPTLVGCRQFCST